MKIIQKNPNPSGAYPSPNCWSKDTPPNGYAIIADTVNLADFYAYNGFVTLTIAGDTVTAYTPNVEAWEAWKASLPEPTAPEPTTEERIAALEAQVAQADETAIELFEMQMAQEEVNMEQDNALIEIFEMIACTAVFAYQAVTDGITQDFMTIYAVIIAFYFGTQSQKMQDAVEGDSHVEQ